MLLSKRGARADYSFPGLVYPFYSIGSSGSCFYYLMVPRDNALSGFVCRIRYIARLMHRLRVLPFTAPGEVVVEKKREIGGGLLG